MNNCESLYCIPVIYITLYIYYTSIKKKKKEFGLNSERHGASQYNEPESTFLGSRWGLGSYLPGLGYNLRQRDTRRGREKKENGERRMAVSGSVGTMILCVRAIKRGWRGLPWGSSG